MKIEIPSQTVQTEEMQLDKSLKRNHSISPNSIKYNKKDSAARTRQEEEGRKEYKEIKYFLSEHANVPSNSCAPACQLRSLRRRP